MYSCPYCRTPTDGALMKDNVHRYKMCQGCLDYIGSPAAQQEGATMQNRIKMERQYNQSLTKDVEVK